MGLARVRQSRRIRHPRKRELNDEYPSDPACSRRSRRNERYRQHDSDRSVEHRVVRKVLPLSPCPEPWLGGSQRRALPAQILSGRRARPRCRLRFWRHDPEHCSTGRPRRGSRWCRLRTDFHRPRYKRNLPKHRSRTLCSSSPTRNATIFEVLTIMSSPGLARCFSICRDWRCVTSGARSRPAASCR